jgi:putative DNA primase/helicase
MSSHAFAARARELTGVASPSEMIRSNQRTYYPSLGLLADAETEATARSMCDHTRPVVSVGLLRSW